MTTVSISGPRYSENIMQLSLLAKSDLCNYPSPSLLSSYLGAKEFQLESWSTDDETGHRSDINFIDRLLKANSKRFEELETNSESNSTVVLDWDGIVLEAVCIARIAQRYRHSTENEGTNLKLAVKCFQDILRTLGVPSGFRSANIRIMIQDDCSVEESVKASLRLDPPNVARFSETFLQKYLQSQKGRFSQVIHSPPTAWPGKAIALHRRVCKEISRASANCNAQPLPHLSMRPTWNSIVCVALSGCGTHKDEITNSFGKWAWLGRCKMIPLSANYLLQNETLRIGADVRKGPPDLLALALVFEIERFVQNVEGPALVLLDSEIPGLSDEERLGVLSEMKSIMGGPDGGQSIRVYMEDTTGNGDRTREIADFVVRKPYQAGTAWNDLINLLKKIFLIPHTMRPPPAAV